MVYTCVVYDEVGGIKEWNPGRLETLLRSGVQAAGGLASGGMIGAQLRPPL